VARHVVQLKFPDQEQAMLVSERTGTTHSERFYNLPATIGIMQIKIVNHSKHALPEYATPFSAGLDLRANIDEPVLLKPLERKMIQTGLFIELPAGYEAQIRPRSGLAIKKGITVLNSPGTIDADYRGEICIILVNLSSEDFIINDGERICQMVIARHEQAEWSEVAELEESDRGAGGFGHTGKH
jgi:dUTP pyrophosphatase